MGPLWLPRRQCGQRQQSGAVVRVLTSPRESGADAGGSGPAAPCLRRWPWRPPCGAGARLRRGRLRVQAEVSVTPNETGAAVPWQTSRVLPRFRRETAAPSAPPRRGAAASGCPSGRQRQSQPRARPGSPSAPPAPSHSRFWPDVCPVTSGRFPGEPALIAGSPETRTGLPPSSGSPGTRWFPGRRGTAVPPLVCVSPSRLLPLSPDDGWDALRSAPL